MTQLARVSEARKIELDRVNVTVTPSFDQTGSIGKDDIQSRLLGVATHLEIDAQADTQKVSTLVATAERMCFLLDAINNTHEVASSVSINGTPHNRTPQS